MTCHNHSTGAFLDTLAQPFTTFSDDTLPELVPGTDTADQVNLQKRARSKYFSTAVALRLVDLDSPLNKQYWNTFHCASTIEVKGSKATAKYCKNRWCLVCNRIRTADLINRYKSTLFEWNDRHFVTLTVPNVPASDLATTVRKMLDDFRKIIHAIRMSSKRGSGSALVAVRKLECTYNPQRNDFHPHFHVVTQNNGMACTLMQQWLSRHPECVEWAQDIRPATKNDLIELFKYFTKILSKSHGNYSLNPQALDTIFQAIRGTRTFQPVGFKLPAVEPGETSDDEFTAEADQAVYFDWIQDFHDWISPDGELLSDYQPTGKLEYLVNSL